MNFPPCSRVMASVRSVLPESTTTISSATVEREARARARRFSSFRVIRQAEMRFIEGGTRGIAVSISQLRDCGALPGALGLAAALLKPQICYARMTPIHQQNINQG